MSRGHRASGVIFIAFLVLGILPGIAWAHGGGAPRLTNVDAGPYWVSVWTQPDPLQVGQAHITVAVSEPTDAGSARREAGAPVLDAIVKVQVKPLDHAGETLVFQATHEGASNKLLFEADVDLPETGRWQVSVAVTGPKGAGGASFEAQVSPPSASSWTWIGGLGLAALAGVWVVNRFRDQKVKD